MTKLIIIGDGPAGVSAALYAIRGNLDVTVISKGYGALEKAHIIENYYGLSKPLNGPLLHDMGVKQVQSLGGNILKHEVVGIDFENGQFKVSTSEKTLFSHALIIATGASRKVPKINGIVDFEGKGVSYCATCDGFFHRNKDVAVLGTGEYALHEAEALSSIAKSVTVLTDGQEPTVTFPKNINVDKRKINKLSGEMTLSNVEFADSSSINISGFFVAQGSATSSDLARKIGVATEKNKIQVNENMSTSVPGIFACGDCTGGMLQVSKAVYEGAVAGSSAIKYLREKAKE